MMRVSRLQKLFASAMLTAAFFGCTVPCSAEPVAFRKALELAIQHSGMVSVAKADQQKAHDLYEQARGAYLPTVLFGSGLGYSNGVPLTLEGSAPSLFNIVSQQALLNFSQREFLRAAKNDWQSSRLDISDKRSEVMLDAATSYLELDNAMVKLKLLSEEAQTANHAEFVTTQRLKEGLDSQLDLKKAQLNVARISMRMAEAQTAADVAREHLARLTGLSAESLETVTDSVPGTPQIQQDQNLAAQAAQNSLAVRLARSKVVTAEFRAKGEERALYPSIDLASQYEMLTRYNNYDEFYRKFQRHNITIGFSMRIPFTDFSQRAKANAASADLLRARKAAEMAESQVEENTLKMQRSIRQLSAATDVARLQYEVAQAGIEATRAKLTTGEATIRDEDNARLNAGDLYLTYLDSQLELSRATLQLLRQTGDLNSWALPVSPIGKN